MALVDYTERAPYAKKRKRRTTSHSQGQPLRLPERGRAGRKPQKAVAGERQSICEVGSHLHILDPALAPRDLETNTSGRSDSSLTGPFLHDLKLLERSGTWRLLPS